MDSYTVLAEGWLEDARGIASYRAAGDPVLLTKEQAKYLKLSGHVEVAKPAVPEKPVKPETK